MLAATQSAQATTYTWNTTTSGALWSASASWVGNAVPTFAAGDTFDLSTLNIGAATTSTMDTVGGNTLGTIKIGDTNNTHSWTLALSTALTLDGNGSAATINQISTSKGDTINGAGGIVLASDLNTTNASGNVLNISTAITATGGTRTITNNGSGFARVNLNGAIGAGINLVQNSTSSETWMLASSTSFNGTITVKAGGFEVGATGANGIGLGTAAFTLGDTSGSSDAFIIFKSGNGSGYSAPITVASGSTGTKSIIGSVTSGNNTYSFSGAIALGADSSHTADVSIGNSTGSTSTYNVTGGFTGFGNVTVKTTGTGRTRLATASINNTGTLTNAGTGTGVAQIDAVVGANVTGVVQNSSTSQMNLNAANTSFAGNVTVSAGTLGVQNTTALNSNNTVAVASGATLSLQTGTLTIAGLNDSTTGGTVTTTTTNTLTLGGSGTYSFSGVIQNGTGTQTLTKNGSGTQTLSGANTYTGATTVSAGTLQVGNGIAGSIASTSGVTVASGATLGINLAASGAFDRTVANSGTVTANGSNANTISGVISGSGAFTQSGSGTTTLSGNNTYTGATTINAGTLALGSADRIADTSALVLNSGTFATGGFSETVGALTLSSSSTLDFGSGTSALVFADSSAKTWSGTLALTNFDIGTDTLRFGSSISALTVSQLNEISLSGYTASLDSSGFVTFTAIPESSTYAGIVGALALAGVVWQRRRRQA